MTLKERTLKMQDLVQALVDEIEVIDVQSYGWKSANKRFRKALQQLREEAKQGRLDSISLDKG